MTGLSLDQLAQNAPRPETLKTVLRDELAAGRVILTGDSYRIVSAAFSPDLLRSLAQLPA